MEYRLLGPLEVVGDGGALIDVPAPKRRALLAALLLEANRPISPARLTEALWGDDAPPAAEASLQAHVSRLRRGVGPGRIETLPAATSSALLPPSSTSAASRTASRPPPGQPGRRSGPRPPTVSACTRPVARPSLADVPCSGYLEPEVASARGAAADRASRAASTPT